VYGLLDEAVAREPREVVPVVDLPFEVGAIGLAGIGRLHRFHRAGVVGRVDRSDGAEFAVVNPLENLAAGVVVAPAEAGDQREVFLLRLGGGFQHRAHARCVGRHRLFAEDVLVCRNRRGQVFRPEAGRGAEQHHIHAAVDYLLVRVEPDEPVVRCDIELLSDRTVSLELSDAAINRVGEYVAHGRQDDVLVAAERIGRRTRASPSASDQANFDRVETAGVGNASDIRRYGQGTAGDCDA
jgi:hypothetical protein